MEQQKQNLSAVPSVQTTDSRQLGEGVPFERIRRITGYLTGDTTTWNNAKQAELRDRVRHL